MDMTIVNKKTVIAFVLGLVLMWIVWWVSASLSTNTLPWWLPRISAETQQRMNEARQAALARSRSMIRSGSMVRSGAALNRPTTGMERILPWTTAVNFIETAPVQKIELLSDLKIKLIMKDGPTFTAIQPTKDAYLVPLKKAQSKIEIVK